MLAADAFAWDTPLSEEEREDLTERAARAVVSRGLQAPAVFALEMHKPLSFLASQMMIVSTPLLGPLVGLDRMQKWGRFLAEPGAVEAVLARIEARSAEQAADAACFSPARKAI